MGLYEQQIEMKIKGYTCIQKQVVLKGKKGIIEVPSEWVDRNVICVLAGSDIQRIK